MIRRTCGAVFLAVLGLTLLAGGGCRHASSSGSAGLREGAPEQAAAPAKDPDFVLNCMISGTDAFCKGDRETAARAFDNALLGIETVYADNEAAKKARSLWHEEGGKDFKGEPYERVMAYYYRGLLYIMEKDYQNARACFKGGMLQDAFAEEEQHRCDFALMLYLSGWCSRAIQDEILAAPTFEELQKLRPDAPLPGQDDNILLIVETGTAPRKLADGVGHYQLKFRRGRNIQDKGASFSISGCETSRLYPLEDVFWQAETRGGRQVDAILQGKAQFRKNASTAGSVMTGMAADAMMVSTVFSDAAGDIQGIAAGIGLVGVMSQAISMKAKTRADTRCWNNLPEAVHVAAFKLPPGERTITVDFLDKDRNPLAGLQRTLKIDVPESGHRLIWLRS